MHYDLLIIGSGSANYVPGKEFGDLKIAMVESGVFAGTCLNWGCIPTKMFVHAANLARQAANSERFGIHTSLNGVDWPAIRDRIFGRIDPISASAKEYRLHHKNNDNLTLYDGVATFTGPKALQIVDGAGTHDVTADRIVIATGSRPRVPAVPGINEVGILNNGSAMRAEKLPKSMIVLGSGYIAAELAAVFSAFQVDVTVVARSSVLLRMHDVDVARTYTELAKENHGVELNFQSTKVERIDGQIHLTGIQDGQERTLVADEIMVATGRKPNADTLNLDAAGIKMDGERVAVDEYQRVLGVDGEPIPGIFALGDVCSPHMLKHVANHEARVVRYNLAHPDAMIKANHFAIPSAVFGAPNVAAVGLTEQAAKEIGVDYVVGKRDYSGIAYGWAMEEPTGFAKVIADRETGKILGGHIIGPQAPTLIQVIIQAMATGQTVQDIARTQYWIHPAMPELVENALLDALKQISAAK